MNETRKRPLVVVADDEESIRDLIRTVLQIADYEVLTANDGDEALEIAKARSPDVMVLDLNMPKKSGTEVFDEIQRHDGSICVIFVSAYDPDAARGRKPKRFVRKPFAPAQLVEAVQACFD